MEASVISQGFDFWLIQGHYHPLRGEIENVRSVYQKVELEAHSEILVRSCWPET